MHLLERIRAWPGLAAHRMTEIEKVLLEFDARIAALEPKAVKPEEKKSLPPVTGAAHPLVAPLIGGGVQPMPTPDPIKPAPQPLPTPNPFDGTRVDS